MKATSIKLRDKNKIVIFTGNLVVVPEPSKKDDYWNHSFQGRVHCRKNGQNSRSNLVVVIDQDDNGWDVEANRLEILT